MALLSTVNLGVMEDTFQPFPEHFGTNANHAGQEPEKWDNMCLVPPITLSTNYRRSGPTEYTKYDYSRHGNPTRDSLETCLAKIENVDYALTFPSGLAAVTALAMMFKSGDHIIAGLGLYGGTVRTLRHFEERMNITASFIDCSKTENIEKQIKPNTKMIYIESPVNPSSLVLDIKKISGVAKKYSLKLVIDNTYLTSYLQKPLELGADMSLYSLTKYHNGHSDVIMGAIVTKHKEYYDELKFIQKSLGLIPSPFDCYLVLRGLKTLHLRMRQHSENALAIAKYLETHPKVENVIYPSLPSHPQYEITKKQTSGSNGMLSFNVKGDEAKCTRFLKSLKVFILAGSLGGTESLVALPYHMTHFHLKPEEKSELGITTNFVRMSVGIEDVKDLIEDIKQALDKC